MSGKTFRRLVLRVHHRLAFKRLHLFGGRGKQACIGCRCQAILAMAAFLQGFFNFCAGCVVFGYLMELGLVSESVYRMHVNTR